MIKGPSYGLSAAVASKIAGKRDPEQEDQAAQWINQLVPGVQWTTFDETLRNGQVLCQLIEKIHPGSVKKINTTGGDFKMMENINKFQAACMDFGVPESDVFQTVDLWDRRNISQVTQAIFALSRVAQSKGLSFPALGPKQSQENKREWSDEQLKAGENVIGLQAGSNKGATQKGMNFGNTRHI